MPSLNNLVSARESAEAAVNTAGEAQAQQLLDARQLEFNTAKRRHDNNKSRAVGDARAPRTPGSGGAPAASMGYAGLQLEEMQRLRRGSNTIAVAGREVRNPKIFHASRKLTACAARAPPLRRGCGWHG